MMLGVMLGVMLRVILWVMLGVNASGWGDACPTGMAVCGIRTKVQEEQGPIGDDTALNDIVMACCTKSDELLK